MDGAQVLSRAERLPLSLSARICALSAAFALVAGWILSSTGLFTVDEYFYHRMAQAMADEGALTFRQFDVAGAPSLDMIFAQPSDEAGRLSSQYPSGYAILAAPFFAAFGAKGLTLLNAIAAFISLLLTYRLGRRIAGDEMIALGATSILALATFWSSYAFAIWPHMLALALALGIVELALRAGESDRRAAIAAGLLIGVGESVRIDMIALAPAIIVWLRLFCGGETRKTALIVAGATAAGLAFPVALNWMQSGAVELISYDNGVPANDIASFAPLAIFGAAALIGVLVFDCRSIFPLRRKSLVVIGASAALACLIAPAAAFGAAHGFWYSLVDAQAYVHLDRQFNIERNDWGWISFYGLSKKALLQCVPLAVLVFLPVRRLLRGEAARGEALLIIVMAAFATLYSVNETDSGVGLNSRFLLPLLPAIAILAAMELRRLIEPGGAEAARFRSIALLAACLFLALRLSNAEAGRLQTPLDLYPQLALAAALLIAVILYAVRPTPAGARAAALLGAASLGAGAATSATDFFQEHGFRAYIADQARLYRAVTPADALVFSTRPMLFDAAAARGLSLAYPGINAFEKEEAVIKAYNAAGRCVYAQGEKALEWALETGLFAAPAALPAAYSQGGLAPLRANPEACPIAP